MSDNKILLSPKQMRAIARYETDFAEAAQLPDDYEDIEDIVYVPEMYQYTPDDLYAAVKNLSEKNPAIKGFGDNWYYPLTQLEEVFGIDAACGEEIYYDAEPEPELVRGLPVTPQDVFAEVWGGFEEILMCYDNETRIADIPEFKAFLQTFEQYYADRDKPLRERTFSDQQKGRLYFIIRIRASAPARI